MGTCFAGGGAPTATSAQPYTHSTSDLTDRPIAKAGALRPASGFGSRLPPRAGGGMDDSDDIMAGDRSFGVSHELGGLDGGWAGPCARARVCLCT